MQGHEEFYMDTIWKRSARKESVLRSPRLCEKPAGVSISSRDPLLELQRRVFPSRNTCGLMPPRNVLEHSTQLALVELPSSLGMPVAPLISMHGVEWTPIPHCCRIHLVGGVRDALQGTPSARRTLAVVQLPLLGQDSRNSK